MYIYSIFDASLGFIRLIRRRNLFLSYEKNFKTESDIIVPLACSCLSWSLGDF